MGGLFKSKSKSTTTSATQVPQEYQAALDEVMGQIKDYMRTPFQEYSGQRIQGLSDRENRAFGLLDAQVGRFNPLVDDAASAARQALQGSGDPTQDDLSRFMNPYTQQVIDASKVRLQDSYERNLSDIKSNAAMAGAFGGTRQGVVEGLASQEFLRTGNELQYGGLRDAYDRAMQNILAFRNDRRQGIDQAIGVAKQGQSVGLTDLAALEAAGKSERAIGQANKDFDYSEFLRKIEDPRNKAAFGSTYIYGYPRDIFTRTQQTVNEQSMSPIQGLMGLASIAAAPFTGGMSLGATAGLTALGGTTANAAGGLGALARGGFREGGLVKRKGKSYAEGGLVRYSKDFESKIRNKPLTPSMLKRLEEAAVAVYGPDASIEVYSGGQSGERRTGSHRHDNGGAADIYVSVGGKRIKDEEQLAKLGQYWAAKGYGGVGFGMHGGGIHLDEVKRNAWGYGPQGATAQSLAKNYPTAHKMIMAGMKGEMPQGIQYSNQGQTPKEKDSYKPRFGLGEFLGLKSALEGRQIADQLNTANAPVERAQMRNLLGNIGLGWTVDAMGALVPNLTGAPSDNPSTPARVMPKEATLGSMAPQGSPGLGFFSNEMPGDWDLRQPAQQEKPDVVQDVIGNLLEKARGLQKPVEEDKMTFFGRPVNKDLLMFGLNLLAAGPGKPGLQAIGEAGLATRAGRLKEEEDLRKTNQDMLNDNMNLLYKEAGIKAMDPARKWQEFQREADYRHKQNKEILGMRALNAQGLESLKADNKATLEGFELFLQNNPGATLEDYKRQMGGGGTVSSQNVEIPYQP